MKKRIVIALGGNALGDTPQQQQKLVRETASSVIGLIEKENELLIVHGNGPQVGMIQLAMNTAAASGAIISNMPLPECDAMSQGYIGYHLQQALGNELKKRNSKKQVVTLVTQVLVDKQDPAFAHPTKPIGAFYSKEAAEKMMQEKGVTMMEDAGRGYRQVVPSPLPLDIIEKEVAFQQLEKGNIAIVAGGGGIPVISKDGELHSVSAVIDKDFAAAKLAELVKADLLIILTAVDYVMIHYGKENQQVLTDLSVEQALAYCEQGQFAKGSMLPKVQAAISFAQCGGEAVITSLKNASRALTKSCGTLIHP